ncbi:nicotinate-nucleotide--dimethylbenzimidazole phosphoribosyltransferase [Streptomyces sp. GS7]|uniref:nicotinate-nucleotide--dimethylbenzimidazole phosphoribosyltransferase n=1 Tax=Streptomyces sp. GS7 TaxID=2692234 RepID=UPI001316409F|nr:nicotinate-nucleotide--dimethylbenzimidazole phosphoribosyltransferase [Streptomyces sp. GS7]QHC22120.1 nicotinate-nucleotide--dimethylbenzimidazole phosphoribosyltransferase [Streptomyces sp. GS7]
MTDTGQVPGEGQPENAGGHRGQPQPAVPSPADAGPTQQPGDYPYLDAAETVPEDDDLLLMPGAQGAWSEQPAQQMPQPAQPQPHAVPQQGGPFDAAAAPQQAAGYEPVPAPAAEHAAVGDHESGGRDSGSVDLGAVRIPQPAAPQPQARARAAAQPAAAPRRPLHMGPPVPDATGGVVRSLADRGPAEVPQAAPRQPAQVSGGPEYLDVPAEAPQAPEAVAVGDQPAEAQPYPEQAAHGDAGYATPPAGAPAYVQQPYDGQLYAEQSYGAAGQGPLPGPQLGEIPSQVPAQVQPWGEASAQAVSVPVPEAAQTPGDADAVAAAAPVPTEPAEQSAVPAVEPTPQPQQPQPDGALPVAQPQAQAQPQTPAQPAPVPAEGAAAAVAAVVVDASGSAVVVEAAEPADAAGAAPGTPVQAPAEAVEQPQHPAAEAAAPQAPVQEAPVQAAPAPVQELPAQDVPVAAAQPQQEATVEAVAQAVADTTAAAAEAEVQPADQAGPAASPGHAEQVPQAAAPQQDAAQPAAAEEAPAASQPVAEPRPAQAESGAPAEHRQPTDAQPVAAAQPVAPEGEPDAAAAPQGPVALPAAESAAPQDQAVIEEPGAQAAESAPAPVAAEGGHSAAPAPAAPVAPEGAQPPAAPQPDAAAAEAPAVADAPAEVPADGAAQPAAAQDAEPVPDAAPAAADQPTADAPAAPAAAAENVVLHIPAQATAEPVPAAGAAPDAAQPAAAEQAPEAAAAADAAHDGTPRPHQQDDAQLVELGEGEDHSPAASQDEAPVAPADGATDGGDTPGAATPAAPAYDDSERAAVHRVIRERRDIRNGFRGDPIPNEVLLRVLEAAHTAPSVGHSQPWDFVVIRSDDTREKMHQLAMRQRDAYAKSLPKARAKQFRELKIEAILETPVNIVVTADPTRGGRHTLGRHTQPQMAPYSSALAVENLWLAARAEGLGVGWVSFFDEREMVRELGLPEHLEVVAYLCVGYVDEFPDEPELLQAGWSKRRPLSWVVHEETYGRRALPGEDPHDLLQETLQGIRPLDAKALGEAWERQKRMTKPAGALGMLEIISAQLSGLSRKCPPPIPEPAAVAIFAGDHGVHAQGVTPWPQEVTGQMVANFLGGGAVCNAFANQVGAEVCVVDVGVAGELPATPGLLPRKVRPGTADFTQGPAMTQEEVLKAIEVGIETARDLVAAGNKALLTGEMGIANTTASAALIAVYTGVDPAEVTGRGTGINDETHARKVDVVRRALELHQPDPADPVGVLAALGGLEHAAIVGLILGGASLRTPVILDGVSAGAAALVARAIAPEALAACIAGHRSAEPGHVAALNKLGLRPIVDLDLRLGEGTGALLALPIVQSAARAMHEVATFDSAGVTEKS